MSKIKSLLLMLMAVVLLSACGEENANSDNSTNSGGGTDGGGNSFYGSVYVGFYKPSGSQNNSFAIKVKNEKELVTYLCHGDEAAVDAVVNENKKGIETLTYRLEGDTAIITGGTTRPIEKIIFKDGKATVMGLNQVMCEAKLYNQTGGSIEEQKKYIFDEINKYRKANGVPELVNAESANLPCLVKVASQRATEIETLFKHERPDGRPLETILDEIKFCQFNRPSSIGEIIAMQPSAEKAMEEWKKSVGHSGTMLKSDFNAAAVGKNGKYYIVFFGRSNL